jgi:hypothetical protein
MLYLIQTFPHFGGTSLSTLTQVSAKANLMTSESNDDTGQHSKAYGQPSWSFPTHDYAYIEYTKNTESPSCLDAVMRCLDVVRLFNVNLMPTEMQPFLIRVHARSLSQVIVPTDLGP